MKYATMLTLALLIAFTTTPGMASSGTLHLTSNTTLAEDHYGNIVIEGDNVTLDCANHTVFGPSASPSAGLIQVAANGVTVRRCTVIGSDVNGLYAQQTTLNGRYENNKIFNSRANGMHIDGGNGHVVIGNISAGQTSGYGIVFTDVSESYIEANTAKTSSTGLGLLAGCHDNILVSNVSTANTNLGYEIHGSKNSIIGNAATLNKSAAGWGVFDAQANEFYVNTANNNYVGFEITGSGGNRFGENVANNNRTEGFKIYATNSNSFFKNTANSNHNIGFYVFAGASYNKLIRNVAHENAQLDAVDDDSGVGNIWMMNLFGTTSGF